MSWKSFVTAGLLCALASPAMADPLVEIRPGGTQANGHLDDDGNWVWRVTLHQTDSPIVDVDNGGIITPGSPLGAELGFEEMISVLIDAVNANEGFDFNNPGNVIYGWEPLTPLGGTGDCSSGDPGDCPVGVLIGTDPGDENQVFTALGSIDYGLDDDGKGYLTITVEGPSTTGVLETNIVMSGAYGGNGRIAELNDDFNPANPTSGSNPFSVNYDIYALDVTRQAVAGDASLDGDVDFDDIQDLLPQFNQPGTWAWYQGDFNGDNAVTFDDLQDLLPNFNQPSGVYTVGNGGQVGGGAGSGGGSPVPEPTSAVLALIAGCLFAARRNRS